MQKMTKLENNDTKMLPTIIYVLRLEIKRLDLELELGLGSEKYR